MHYNSMCLKMRCPTSRMNRGVGAGDMGGGVGEEGGKRVSYQI